MDALQRWAADELGAADFGQGARTTRAVAMLAQMAATPAGTVSAVFTQPAARKAAYRWLENPAVTPAALADAMCAACAVRCRDHAQVIVPIDGSSLRHTDRVGDDGVGRIGSDKAGARGLKTMVALVLAADGVPLGLGALALWARPPTPHPTPHAKRALADKESRYWTTLQADVEAALAAAGAATTPWYQLDREGDSNPVLLRGLEAGQTFTVRARHDRLLQAKSDRRHHLKLRAALTDAAPWGVTYVDVPASKVRPAHVARLEVRVVGVSAKLRAQWSHRKLGEVGVTAVWVREVGTVPAGAEPLDWLLLTSAPVATWDDAVRVVRAYALRWMIERVHYTWKSGACAVEASQLESFAALSKWATLHLRVAIERQHVLHLARTQPALPADEVFDRDAIDAALTLFTSHRADGPRPGTTPSLGTLVEIIARLGGYTGKSSGGPPGVKVFGRGLERVETVALAFRLQRQLGHTPTSNDGFG